VAPPPSGALLPGLLVRNPFANGGHVLICRQAIDAVGGFNTGLCYGEDWEYWIRLALQGEFVSIRTPQPLLFVRERAGSAYHHLATDPARFIPCMDAVYGNPAVVSRVGASRLARLRRRAEAENAWVIGRELIRHQRLEEGLSWLRRSLRGAPGLKRLVMLGLSQLEIGPFRPYETRHSAATSRRRCGGRLTSPGNNFTAYRQCD
jgi:GT2 family glycosyltransferase